MSLINDVLRDLERRRPRGGGEVLTGVHGAPAGRAGSRLPWGALALLPIAAGVGYWVVSGALAGADSGPGDALPVPAPPAFEAAPATNNGPVVMRLAEPDPAEPIAVAEPPPVSGSSPEPAPGVRWVGVDTERRQDAMRMTLRFSAAPDPQPALVLEEDEGRLSLAGVDLVDAPPLPSAPESGPLLALGLSAGQQAQLRFRVAPGVRTTLEQGDGGRRLTLRFDSPETPARAATPKPSGTRPPGKPAVADTSAAAPAAVAPRSAAATPRVVARRSPGDHYSQALAAIRAGDVPAGEQGLRRALAAREDLHEARHALATLLAGEGRHGEAVALLNDGLEQAPGHTELTGLLARIKVQRGDHAGAIRLLEAGTGDPQLLATLGALYQGQGRAAESAAAYRRALETNPAVGAWWVGLAIALEGSGEPAGAPEAYRRALRLGGLATRLDRYARERLAALETRP
jgi:MSHA biogenesis protein MshN